LRRFAIAGEKFGHRRFCGQGQISPLPLRWTRASANGTAKRGIYRPKLSTWRRSRNYRVIHCLSPESPTEQIDAENKWARQKGKPLTRCQAMPDTKPLPGRDGDRENTVGPIGYNTLIARLSPLILGSHVSCANGLAEARLYEDHSQILYPLPISKSR
jgi:hypothetical protein